MSTITRLPEAPEHFRQGFDQWQFDGQKPRAVSKENRISWQDFGRMHVSSRSQNNFQRRPVPTWVLESDKTREVICRYLEARLYLNTPPCLSHCERLALIDKESKSRVIKQKLRLDSLIDAEKAGTVGYREVQNLDSQILLAERGIAAVIATVVYLKYRCFQDSPAIAEEVHLHPPAVRIILYRCNLIAERLWPGSSNHSGEVRSLAGKRKWTAEKMAVIKYFREAGWPWRAIAAEFGVKTIDVCGAWIRNKASVTSSCGTEAK